MRIDCPHAYAPQEIIEPVLKNQYLTKLQRLLPSFFDEFKKGEIETAIMGSGRGRIRTRSRHEEEEDSKDKKSMSSKSKEK